MVRSLYAQLDSLRWILCGGDISVAIMVESADALDHTENHLCTCFGCRDPT